MSGSTRYSVDEFEPEAINIYIKSSVSGVQRRIIPLVVFTSSALFW